MTDKALLPREAARKLGITMQAVYALLWSGKLPAEKNQGCWAIPLSAVEARLREREARRHAAH